MKSTEKAQVTLGEILALFESGDLPEAVAHSTLAMPDVPAKHWSLGNRLLVWQAGTVDARTYRQWQSAGRQVVKGAKALHILQPCHVKIHNDGGGDAEEKPAVRLVGFRACPVFRAEDTDGEPLGYQLDPPQPPPLLEVARAWGIEVRYLPQQRAGVLGYHRSGGRDGSVEIGLHTHQVQTFAHELAHAAHARVRGKLQGGQHWDQEIVAELTAATLCRMLGADPDEGGAYRYIRHYAQKAHLDPTKACMAVLKDVEACLSLILTTATSAKLAA
jgi:antirestriction protein ArdC